MSWTDGNGLFGELSYIVRKAVPDRESRREIYDHMLDAFIEVGWDGHPDDLRGDDPVLDDVLDERWPPEETEPEEDEEDYE